MKHIFCTLSLFSNFLLIGMDNVSLVNVSAAHLLSAMKKNDFLQAKELLKINPNIVHEEIAPAYLHDIITPLHCSPNQEWSQLLIEHGAKVNHRSNQGLTLLDRICMNPKIANTSHALYLINCGANVNNVNNRSNSLLHNIIKYNEYYDTTWISFLLRHNVDIHKKDEKGSTPLDLAILKSNTKLIKCFEKAGIMFFSVNNYNVYDLLKDNARKFKKALENTSDTNNNDHTMECRLAELFMFIKKCEQKRDNNRIKNSPSTQGIIRNSYGYIFHNTTFYELGLLVGRKGVNYVRKHFQKLCENAEWTLLTLRDPETFKKIITAYPFIMNYDKKLRSRFCEYMVFDMKGDSMVVPSCMLNCIKNINFVDHNGNNLLHRAVLAYNVPLLRFMTREDFHPRIDFTKKNNVNLTPLAMAKKYNNTGCIEALYKGLAISLRSISQYDAYSQNVIHFLNEECDINRINSKKRTLLFEMARPSYDGLYWCAFLLQKGAKVNLLDNEGDSPLSHAISTLCLLSHNSYLSSINNKIMLDLIQLFISNGAVVTDAMLNLTKIAMPNPTRKEEFIKILQKAYDQQACCICLENPKEINEIPCKNIHKGNFLCEDCYNNIKKQNNLCPLDREPLNKYESFQ